MRSCEPRVVRWRVMASFARVIAVEKPMQYSVPRTSLSIVLGTPITGNPALERAAAKAERVVAADGDQAADAQALQILQTMGVKSYDLPSKGSLPNAAARDVREPWRSRHGADLCGKYAGRCRRCGQSSWYFRGSARAHKSRRIFRRGSCASVPSTPCECRLRSPHFGGAIYHGLDYGVQAGHVASARQNSDAGSRGHESIAPCGFKTAELFKIRSQ